MSLRRAFAYLTQKWEPNSLGRALATAGLNMSKFIAAYSAAIPYTMGLCEKVMANCFVNASYDPTRNGTCKSKIYEFHYLGFDRENLLRKNIVKYPFF